MVRALRADQTLRKGRLHAAVALGLAAIVAGAVAARGPAIPDQAQLAWPPVELPSASPTRAWLTPVLLARHFAASLEADVPCGKQAALAEAGKSIVLLATARDAVRRAGLEVVRSAVSGASVVRVGSLELARFGRSADRDCLLRIRFDGGDWTIGRSGEPPRRGRLAQAPSVYGLITELDLRATRALSVTLRPVAQDSHPSTKQSAFRILCALLVAAAIVLARPTAPRRRNLPHVRLAACDGVVALVLGVWWLVAPLQDDDGWVRARQTNSLASGGFSNYYEHWGANLPLATWLEWLQHFVVAHTSSLALDRLPSVVALLATWFVCRACLTRLLGVAPVSNDSAWWSAAITFVVGAVAFGVTLRPEPASALLATAVFACCVFYLSAASFDLLVVAVLVAGLAVTVHPAGVISLAPLLLCFPRIVRDARTSRPMPPLSLMTLTSIGVAWALLLAFLDGDKSTRDDSVALIRGGGGHGGGILQELDRYARLSDGGASALRRLFVALLVLAAGASVLALLRRQPLTARLPSASVALALLFLAVTPSKWIWHFGGLIGIGAVAIGFEVHRLSQSRPPIGMRLGVALGVVAAAVWAASEPNNWGPLGTGRLGWALIPAPYLCAIVAAGACAVLARRLDFAQRLDTILLPAVLAAVLTTAVALVAIDAIVTPDWTPGRQAVSSLVGRDACGIASELPVSWPASQPRIVDQATLDRERSIWFPVPDIRVGMFVAGSWRATNTLTIEWGRETRTGVERLGSGRADLRNATQGPDPSRWTFVDQSSLPERPANADRLRFRMHAGRDRAGARITRPIPYASVSLAKLLDRLGRRSLVSPYLFEAIPCARLTRLSYGVAEVPELLVDYVPDPPLTSFSSPVVGISNILDLVRLPTRSAVGWGPIYVYVARPDPRDVIAPPTRRIEQ